MRQLLVTVIVLFALLVLTEARPKNAKNTKQRPQGDPAVKVFEFLDTKNEGKIPVPEIKQRIQKILPLSDDKDIDKDGDNFVTLDEFKKFYATQYQEWATKSQLKTKN